MSQKTRQIPLSNVPIGTQATIIRIGGPQLTRRRLLDMGMITGETITMKAVAPLGDPIELLIKGYHLSLRKHEAHEILVEVAA